MTKGVAIRADDITFVHLVYKVLFGDSVVELNRVRNGETLYTTNVIKVHHAIWIRDVTVETCDRFALAD